MSCGGGCSSSADTLDDDGGGGAGGVCASGSGSCSTANGGKKNPKTRLRNSTYEQTKVRGLQFLEFASLHSVVIFKTLREVHAFCFRAEADCLQSSNT